MYRIEKIALNLSVGLVIAAVGAAILFPFMSGQEEKQRKIDKGSKIIDTTFLRVQPNKGTAILLAPSRNKRGYDIILNKKSEYEWNQPTTHNAPVPIPVTVGTHFTFYNRHKGFDYRVTAVNPKGVEVEIGRDS